MTSDNRLIRWGHTGLLSLVTFMPFHAFAVVWLASLAGHQTVWAFWKELLLIIITALAIYGYIKPKNRLETTVLQTPLATLIAAYAVWSVGLSLILRVPLTQLLFGAKTNLEFLLAFLLGWQFSTRELSAKFARIILIGSAFVAGFGLLQIFILPADFLKHFGYGPATILPYLGIAGSGAVRILSTLGGPNQLGSYLILPLCLTLALALKRFRAWQPILIISLLLTLFHTYSRSAWIGALLAMTVTVLVGLKPKQLGVAVGGLALIGAVSILALSSLIPRSQTLQYYLYHNNTSQHFIVGSSDGDRISSQTAGVKTIKNHVMGEGLGSAGPASFHSDHPFVTEDYYLQLGVEVGLLGLGLFLAICVLLAIQLWPLRQQPLAAAALGALVGVSVVNLFLHGWTDSTTALVFWTTAGTILGERQ